MLTAQKFLSRLHHRAPTVPEDRRKQLGRLGYKVEDMGAEYGPSYSGQWRFINIFTGEFQDVDTSMSENCAWHEAHLHAQERGE